MRKLSALPVKRDEMGQWCHPVYAALFGHRESISPDEFKVWTTSQGVKSAIVELECDADEKAIKSYFEDGNPDFSGWTPSKPTEGDGWFIGSIHDTEYGPVCIWFCKVSGS